jgi:hypothetical protein
VSKHRVIHRGDLVLVRSTLRSAIVLVTGVYKKHFNACLIHTFPEMATDADVVFPKGTVLPYPVVVNFDLYGCYLPSQAARVLGRLDLPERLSIDPYVAAQAAATHHNAWRGLPCWRGTPRWDEKIRLLEEEVQPLVYPFWEGFKW